MNTNYPLCYKCKKNNAIVWTREKSCKECFLQLVEYTFKNTLREKCLFKNKGNHNYQVVQQYEKENEKRKDIQEKKCFKMLVEDEHVHNITRNNFKHVNTGKYVKESEKNGKIMMNTLYVQQEKKRTAIAFSGDICSSFLLFSFVKYLKNVKNRKNDFYLTNEYCIFSDIIFVDIFEDENYIFKLIKSIQEIFRILEENDDLKGRIKKNEMNEEMINTEKETLTIQGNEKIHDDINDESNPSIDNNKILFINGVFKKKVNKVHFTVLKSNYFVNECYKNEFLVYYDLIKKEKNYYLNYMNELIIYNNILKYGIDENINYVFWGNNANNISNKSFLYTIFGNGINLPICTAYIDNRYKNINFIKPLKDLLNKEIYIYCYYKNITYLHNTLFDNNIVYRTINEMLSTLDSKNNTTSIINNTIGNLVNLMNVPNVINEMNHSNRRKHSHECMEMSEGKNVKNHNYSDINMHDAVKTGNIGIIPKISHSYNGFEKDYKMNCMKECVNNYKICSACYICSGNKETKEEKTFIKKLNKIQLSNLEKMKYTNLICSTCLSIFSSSENCVNLFNVFF
ncbi:hypothetical protein, conserved [Plasmodium gonderi]|uniref:Cytoplasmic tRNA 2-thiolation protein 2 n=1 Tax=Plasmodium gonderi TaxID=77519 RepID=A0A1Y1JJK3_PLAGO|nr:hypothetical protein, conserved [Plasmodium gonderi]GAW82676.1 hypothetical protein, conserved [Plasmodium gonderi]